MSAVEILLGAVEPIGLRLRRGQTLLTGATVRARVLRTSDGRELDWSTNTFVAAGTAVQPRKVLTEAPASSGAYEYAWDTSTVSNPTTPDTYLVEYDQTAPTARVFLKQSEVRVRAIQAISAEEGSSPTAIAAAVWATPEGSGTMGAALALLRRRTTNRRKLDAGGTITFYDDANSPEASATLTDVNGGPIVVVPGDPAESTAET